MNAGRVLMRDGFMPIFRRRLPIFPERVSIQAGFIAMKAERIPISVFRIFDLP